MPAASSTDFSQIRIEIVAEMDRLHWKEQGN
jgi:hypothetical protein